MTNNIRSILSDQQLKAQHELARILWADSMGIDAYPERTKAERQLIARARRWIASRLVKLANHIDLPWRVWGEL